MDNLEIYYLIENNKMYYLEIEKDERYILIEYLKNPSIKIYKNCSNLGVFDEIKTEDLENE